MHIKDIKNNLKVLKKRAVGSVGTAIKVLTSVVLGASVLAGGYALTSEVVLPSASENVQSMFAYSAEADVNTNGSGTVAPTPEVTVEETTFSITYIDWSTSMDAATGETRITKVYTVSADTTWNDWVNDNPTEYLEETGKTINIEIFADYVAFNTCSLNNNVNIYEPIVAGQYSVDVWC